MANNLLGIGVSGLRLSQSALSTVGHNIANANTEGYSRQRVDPVTNPANLYGGGYIGNGVNVDSVDRIVNGFVTEQMRTDASLHADLDQYYNQISQLDNLLSNESTGLSASLNSFFASIQNGADDPTSIPSRQLIVSEADNLADRFNSIYGRLTSIESGIEDGMEVAVSRINALASNVAQLNVKISDAYGVGNGAPPNDLLDQREQALKELSSYVNIQVFEQGAGQINVVIGTGQSLVTGPDASRLSLQQSSQDPKELDVVYNSGGRAQVVTGNIQGGELGGLIRFRDTALDNVYNSVGRIATTLADSFNTLNKQGITLDNQFGENIFYDINAPAIAQDRVIANSGNAVANGQNMALYIRDSKSIEATDYKVRISAGGTYQITRESDGKNVVSGLLPGTLPHTVEFDGLELEFGKGSYQPGDSFLLQPVKTGAQDFSAIISSPEQLAFASPVLTDASLSNLGSGKISAGEVVALQDVNGNPLPLFANAGQMDPPLVVVFNSPTSYDIMDNSDPGNPVHLDPPIRDQLYVPGVTNKLFSELPGATVVSTNGDMTGLPDGRSPVTQSALLPATAAPDFTVTDFSGANQFSFQLEVANTVSGSRDGVYNININGASITDEQALLSQINAQLSGSDVEAYYNNVGGTEQLAFRLKTPGHGDIDLTYTGGAGNVGVASNLTGIDFNNTYSTVGDDDGVSGSGLLTNGYPAESFSFTRPSATPGGAPVTTNIVTGMNASAREIASQLSDLPGVQANAFNYVELSNLNVTQSAPLQITLNGQNLIEYTAGASGAVDTLGTSVPDPVSQPGAFYDYLAEQINANPALKTQGIYAVAGTDANTGEAELRVFSPEGDDFQVGLTAAAGESIDVSDGEHGSLALAGSGTGVSSQIVVGGKLDVTMDEGVTMSSRPPVSMLFGDTTRSDFAQNSYLGLQAEMTGSPAAGDSFAILFNTDAASDNRNALLMANLQSAKVLGGSTSFNQGYGTLVEEVGIDTSATKINRDAAEQVKNQTEALRESISGVNLDEEAADLIRFEQLFSANAQVISVARDIFDKLLGSF